MSNILYITASIRSDSESVSRSLGQRIVDGLAAKTGEVIGARDLRAAAEMESDDDAMDELHRGLFTMLLAPQWTHGGVALGPKPRSYNYHINNKVKRLALLSVLSDKAANGNMVVVDKFACDEYKTKTVVSMLNAVGAGKKNLLVNETVDAKFVKSAGNIAGVKTTFAGSVNTYDVLNADKLIISVDAAKKLEEVLG